MSSNHKEEIFTKFEIVKKSTDHQSLEEESSNSHSHNSQDIKEEHNQIEVSSKTPSSSSEDDDDEKEEEEEEEEEDGFRTPTSLDHKISVITCPPAPKKIKVQSLKRKAGAAAESKKLTLSASLSRSHSSFWSIINRRDLPPPPPPHPILFVPFVTSPSHCCNFFFTVSKESNIGMMSSQVESNMRVESSIEVVTGGGLLDSSTVVESNMSFMELLATCEIGFKGSTESRTNVE
ncbi:hypothetical protein P8452_64650 [Trifolium repens]|nr:hypothetical protein P8452_64650 [Trifolium repens]